MIKVSVLVPVYNVEKYLKQCINSILQQTLQDIEVICIDDGSTDSSGKILDEYVKQDCRIKVVHKENTGYGDSMNRALEMAQGEYIGIVESDDFIEKEMYQRYYTIAVEKNLDFLKADHYEHWDDRRVYRSAYHGSVYNHVFNSKESVEKFDNTNMAIWAGLYKTSFLKSNHIKFNPTPGASYQDVSYMFKVYISAKRGYVLNEAYVNYRMDNVASSVKSKKKIYCVCDEITECKRFLMERKDATFFMPYLIKMMFYVYRWNIGRIGTEYLKEFIFYISSEFKVNKESNYINKDLFSNEEWWQLSIIAEFPEKYLQIKMQDRIRIIADNNSIYINAYVQKFNNYKNVYIYGAGKIGKKLECVIRNINQQCFVHYVVTNKIEQNDESIIEITDNSINIEWPIIVAVANETDKAIMVYQAKEQGFKEIIAVDSVWYEMMRRFV